jgi:hypothetical protein
VNKEDIKEAVLEALEELPHQCQFNLSQRQADILTHHLGSIADMGKGDMAKGILEMQENHRFTMNQRSFVNTVARGVGLAVLTLTGFGIVWALFEGVKHFLTTK